ncbi:carbon storage regulator [Paludisphaera mucosa]|uniref:Translational regulator CsrA n=1 Tax=Paludisphaera mucosa TaxID=3030827 RepID=A0ABT6F9X1_9BACT|nr:carbon storage regulator [Paludisphaera mucosa]MDG3004180.1 carbon storage regulator [Paludisphaera mucosa]
MLVLSRKLGEVIQIGSDIRIVVAKIDGHQVRIGIEAPMSVSIKRQEICFELPNEREADRLMQAVGA